MQIWLIEACTESKNIAESHESKHTKFRVWSHVWTRNQYVSVSLKAPLPTRRDNTFDAMLKHRKLSFLTEASLRNKAAPRFSCYATELDHHFVVISRSRNQIEILTWFSTLNLSLRLGTLQQIKNFIFTYRLIDSHG